MNQDEYFAALRDLAQERLTLMTEKNAIQAELMDVNERLIANQATVLKLFERPPLLESAARLMLYELMATFRNSLT